jgi:hypothetical protein
MQVQTMFGNIQGGPLKQAEAFFRSEEYYAINGHPPLMHRFYHPEEEDHGPLLSSLHNHTPPGKPDEGRTSDGRTDQP